MGGSGANERDLWLMLKLYEVGTITRYRGECWPTRKERTLRMERKSRETKEKREEGKESKKSTHFRAGCCAQL